MCVLMTDQFWMRTALSEVPMKERMRRCCLIQREKSAICHRQRYNSANQTLHRVGIDPPVAPLVDVDQHVAEHPTAKPHLVRQFGARGHRYLKLS